MSRLLKEAKSRRRHWSDLQAKGLTMGFGRSACARWVEEWIEEITRVHGKAPNPAQERTHVDNLRTACLNMSAVLAPKDAAFYDAAALEAFHLMRFTKE